jgi:hypothetical protein
VASSSFFLLFSIFVLPPHCHHLLVLLARHRGLSSSVNWCILDQQRVSCLRLEIIFFLYFPPFMWVAGCEWGVVLPRCGLVGSETRAGWESVSERGVSFAAADLLFLWMDLVSS